MAYIDVKHTVWKRYHMEDKEFEKFMQLDEKEKYRSVFNHVDDADGEWMYETEQSISYEENSDNPTIEVFGKRNSLSWDNTPLDVKRQKKIEQIKI